MPCITYAEWQQCFPISWFSTSHSVIIASYVHQCQLNTATYHLHMSNLTINSKEPYLTCDHTFKTAGKKCTHSVHSHECTRDIHYKACLLWMPETPPSADTCCMPTFLHRHTCDSYLLVAILYAVNIGMHHPEDNKWVTQCSVLFCVLDSNAQILTWKLTSSVRFVHYTDVLTHLHNQLERQGKVVS